MLLVAAALLRATVACRIDQDMAHRTRSDREKMGPIVQGQMRTGQFQIGFVNQQGGRHRSVAAAGKLQVRTSPEILIDRLKQRVVGTLIAAGAALHQAMRVLRRNLCRTVHASQPRAEATVLTTS